MNIVAEWDLVDVAAAVAGEEWALAALAAALWPTVQAVCRRSVERDAAPDVAQDAMERIVRSLPGFRSDGSLEGWARRVTRSVCVDHLRRRRRQERLAARMVGGEEGGDLPTTIGVENLLACLDPDQRAAFAATQLAGLTYEEAAAEAGCAVGTIRSRVARARDRLRFELADG